jgi:hypothetical protein
MQRSDVVLLAAWKRGRFFKPFRPHALANSSYL